MKTRTVLKRFTEPSRSMQENDRPHINRIKLPLEPWHIDTPPAAHVRPSEVSVYLQTATFGASGSAQPDWRAK